VVGIFLICRIGLCTCLFRLGVDLALTSDCANKIFFRKIFFREILGKDLLVSFLLKDSVNKAS